MYTQVSAESTTYTRQTYVKKGEVDFYCKKKKTNWCAINRRNHCMFSKIIP